MGIETARLRGIFNGNNICCIQSQIYRGDLLIDYDFFP